MKAITNTGPKIVRRLIIGVAIYLVYLAALGPFHAINGRGYIDFVPPLFRNLPYYPAAPLLWLRADVNPYDSYLDLWFQDPNEPETTP